MSGRWFKVSEAILFDRRKQKLPAGLFRCFVNLMACRSWSGGRLPSLEDMSFILRTSPDALARRLRRLEEAGLVVETNGVWEIVEDQEDADPLSPAERTRRWRERRQRDGACDGVGDASVTARDAQNREDSEETESARERDEGFEKFLAAFPEREEPHALAPARAAWRKAIDEGEDPEAIIAGARSYRTATAGRERRFVASAARWLSEGRWRGAGAKPAGPIEEPGVWIPGDSPEWRAWAVHWHETRGVSPPRDSKNGWRFPTPLPPARIAAGV
ncbi:MAG: hypothetical protein EKK29_17300 [Hyphomicrobiales bacterium]|nr:MAG: hypothetical protein EKK29_17300 [Hyphomicrobiales bacterium]